MIVIPPARDKENATALADMKRNSKLCHCWVCNSGVSIRKYSDHMDRHRKEGFVPRDRFKGRPKAEVFAEWRQEDIC